MADTNPPIFHLTLATDRDDKGQTENYRVYAGGGQVQVTNKRGEHVVKNAILGSNGTIYIANELAKGHDAWVLLPRTVYQKLAAAGAQPPRTAPPQTGSGAVPRHPVPKKGKGK